MEYRPGSALPRTKLFTALALVRHHGGEIAVSLMHTLEADCFKKFSGLLPIGQPLVNSSGQV